MFCPRAKRGIKKFPEYVLYIALSVRLSLLTSIDVFRQFSQLHYFNVHSFLLTHLDHAMRKKTAHRSAASVDNKDPDQPEYVCSLVGSFDSR